MNLEQGLGSNFIKLFSVSAILTFLTFTIGKFENSKFQNCLSEPEILQSYFLITNSKT
jgi:hypothetical protein